MLKEFPADLHVHTCLSPCAEDEMVPPNILNMARLMGIKILGVADHNSAKNLPAMVEASCGFDGLILPGIEVQTREEVHVLCYFESLKVAMEFQDFIYEHLPPKKNDPRRLGRQYLVDKMGNVTGEEERLLIASADLSVDEVAEKVFDFGGIFIPAHVERMSFGIIGQLGFIPEDMKVHAVEFSKNVSVDEARYRFPDIFAKYPVVFSSDAHCLKDMVFRKTYFLLEKPTFEEVKRAFKGWGGRRVVLKDKF
ncbi:PHP domain-containing protein [Thermovorax subterraneus]|nr:PHP domain-containing protein [Thermovorax subterraneus]